MKTTKLTACCSILAASFFTFTPAKAGPAPMVDTKEIAPVSAPFKDWTLEVSSGVSFSNVRESGDAGYTIVPATLSASLKLDEVGNDTIFNGIFRGNTEFFFTAGGAAVVSGPESRFGELLVGPRYNFVQPNWKFIPYIDAGVGLLFADSNPAAHGLGQDFNFTFTTGAGVKYLINDSWFARVGVEYQHISNAGLSEPQHPNNAVDALGPKISVGYAF